MLQAQSVDLGPSSSCPEAEVTHPISSYSTVKRNLNPSAPRDSEGSRAGWPHRLTRSASLSADPWVTESPSSSARRAAEKRLRPRSNPFGPYRYSNPCPRPPITRAPTHLAEAVRPAAFAPTAARAPLRLPPPSPAQLSADWLAPLCVTPRRRPRANQRGPLPAEERKQDSQ